MAFILNLADPQIRKMMIKSMYRKCDLEPKMLVCHLNSSYPLIYIFTLQI